MKTTFVNKTTECPICKENVHAIREHLNLSHTQRDIESAIISDKKKGLSDVEIGGKYGITYRQLEKIIRKATGVSVSFIRPKKKIKNLFPKDFKEETTTVWSFKQRGNWATHSGEYRGNWSPYIPRNVILKYSKPGELVLDYFCGAGTTAVEAKLLCRRCIAFDINDKAIELAKKNVDFEVPTKELLLQKIYEPELFVKDARDLSFLRSDSIDLICAHPPYANIIHYTEHNEGDLSYLDTEHFLKEMKKVAKESYRVLKPGRQCAILIGDMRRHRHVIPLGFELINVYLNAGFKLKELVIKRQHNCKTTGFWYANSIKFNFLLLAHEYLPIFEKPKPHALLTIGEEMLDYGVVVPTLEKPSIRKRIDELETTTVWILPEKDFEKHLNKNVIERYSKDGYSTITFSLSFENKKHSLEHKEKKKQGLLFIKSPFLVNNISPSNIEFYLKEIIDIVERNSFSIFKGGFIVIQTKDVRIGRYIEPLAKRIVDMLTLDNLWLKEIVVVTQEKQNSRVQSVDEHLNITHQYLLVYEVNK
ncbi:MAG: DNA methyltransferase [Thermodesulfovibrionales bacterium]|nr:DNA methyltransferase [Thermodesulfovibrionales bacterium]